LKATNISEDTRVKDLTEDELTQIRNEVPNIHLRTTLMVGHADETEEDFKDLMDFVRRMRFERMGAFMYSEEEGTYSAIHYEDNVSEEEKQRRLEELMTLQEDIALEINREKIGKTLKVIIDREEDDYYIGRTEYDSPEVDGEVLIKMKGQKMVIGEFYDVTIADADAFDLYVN
jgi:ribosomal protein S12 methylthiotransferase